MGVYVLQCRACRWIRQPNPIKLASRSYCALGFFNGCGLPYGNLHGWAVRLHDCCGPAFILVLFGGRGPTVGNKWVGVYLWALHACRRSRVPSACVTVVGSTYEIKVHLQERATLDTCRSFSALCPILSVACPEGEGVYAHTAKRSRPTCASGAACGCLCAGAKSCSSRGGACVRYVGCWPVVGPVAAGCALGMGSACRLHLRN